MKQEHTDLIEQIERCRRLSKELTDPQMREALEQLARHYEARLKQGKERSFMLRDRR